MADMNAAYVGLGFTANAALKIVTQQGIDSLEELRYRLARGTS